MLGLRIGVAVCSFHVVLTAIMWHGCLLNFTGCMRLVRGRGVTMLLLLLLLLLLLSALL